MKKKLHQKLYELPQRKGAIPVVSTVLFSLLLALLPESLRNTIVDLLSF